MHIDIFVSLFDTSGVNAFISCNRIPFIGVSAHCFARTQSNLDALAQSMNAIHVVGREEAWRERKMQRMEQRREEALKKLSDYQVTEDEKLDPFRALISESGGSIKIPKRSGA